MKKLIDFIFEPIEEEEQEEVVLDKPLKPHSFTEERPSFLEERPMFKTEKKEVETRRSTQTKPLSEPKQSQVKKKEVTDKTFIDADSAIKQSNNNYGNIKPISKYESQPAISPMFGQLGAKPSNDANFIQKSPSTKKSSLGTVLSPIYGDMAQNRASEENINKKSSDFKLYEPEANELRTEIEVAREELVGETIRGKTPMSSILDNIHDEEKQNDSTEEITLFDDFED